MKLTKSIESNIAILALAVALCFSFFAVGVTSAQAEETEDTDVAEEVEMAEDGDEMDDVDDDSEADETIKEKHAAMKAQIDSLRAMIAERKEAAKEQHQEMKEEMKADFKINKADFMASLEGLEEEDKRAAMMAFIENIKAVIAAKKAEMEANREIAKEQRQEIKETFRADLEGLTREERIAVIMARVAEIKKQIEDQAEAEGVDEDESDSSEDTDEDESDDSDEDDDTEEDDDDSNEDPAV